MKKIILSEPTELTVELLSTKHIACLMIQKTVSPHDCNCVIMFESEVEDTIEALQEILKVMKENK